MLSSSKRSKFINYIVKNTKSCLPLVEEVKALEREINEKFNSFVALINKDREEKLELFVTKISNNTADIAALNKRYDDYKLESEEKFTEKLEYSEIKLIESWLKSNQNCILDIVAHTEERMLDSFKNCVISSGSDDGLSGCINSVELLLKDIA